MIVLETVVKEVEAVQWMSISFLMVLLIAIISASLSLFLEMTMESGMIFRRYKVLLTYYWIKWRKKPKKRKLLKPLGLCVYCYSVWFYVILHIACLKINWFLFAGIGLNFVILKIFERYTKQ